MVNANELRAHIIRKLSLSGRSPMMAAVTIKRRNLNFNKCEVDVLLSEVKTRKNIILGNHTTGITNKRKYVEWQQITAAVNAVSSTERAVPEVKKKWQDLKVEGKKRLAAHRASTEASDGNNPTPLLSDFEKRMASIIGDSPLCSVVAEQSETTDEVHETTEKKPAVTVGLDAGVSTEESNVPGPSAISRETLTPPPPPPRVPKTQSSGRVLTDAVLQTQRDTITAIREVAKELREIKGVLSEISVSLKDFF